MASAFDKVNHFALYGKLMDRQFPRNIICMLYCWYDKVFTVVKWNNCFSNMIRLTAGVHQEGVLSPYLFAIFVDDVLIKLKNSALGCHINKICLNAVMYADNLLLMAISTFKKWSTYVFRSLIQFT